MAYLAVGNRKRTVHGQNSSKQIMNNSSVAEVVIGVIIGEQGRRAVRVGSGCGRKLGQGTRH